MARIAIMALEGLEEPQVQETSIPIEEIAEQPEQEMLEMQEVAQEADEVMDAIDESAETAETLEVVADRMQDTIEDGGMDEKSAEVVRVAVEAMVMRLGFPARKASFAMEGFSDKKSRVRSTQIALEGIKDMAKAIWQAIVNAFTKAIELVSGFFRKMFASTEKMTARADKIIAAANALKDHKETEVKVNAAMTMYMRDQNKIAEPAKLVSSLKELASTADFDLPQIADLAIKAAADLFKTVHDKDSFTKTAQSLKTGDSTPDPKTGMSIQNVSEFNLTYKRIEVSAIPKGSSDEEVFKLIDKLGARLVKDPSWKAIDVSGTVKGLTKEQILSAADSVKNLLKVSELSKQSSEKYEAALKKLTSEAKTLSNKASTNEDKDELERIKACQRIVKAILTMITQTMRESDSDSINVANCVLNYCASSMGGVSKDTKVEAAKGDGSDPKLENKTGKK